MHICRACCSKKSRLQEMDMREFQFIWTMEYVHRMWARALGLAFFLPAAYFWTRGWFRPAMMKRVVIAGGLIVFQASCCGQFFWPNHSILTQGVSGIRIRIQSKSAPAMPVHAGMLGHCNRSLAQEFHMETDHPWSAAASPMNSWHAAHG